LRAEIEIGAARERERQRRGGRAAAEKVKLTYVGLFETRENFDSEVGRDRNGRSVANGFGPGNIAPGQLFVDSVRDILVEFVIRAPLK
jgi:hypothetical protein